ncbi:optic atrophy 3 protein homolog [Dysidea avara]|uniref:optic atrophy 3 protein homolog n=1 Tax=Dysidea avara TaxID=196820 RepID=UPI00331FA783
MVAVFPVGKLVYLGVKQISKPIARALQAYARRNEFMRLYVCSPPAQAYHKLQVFVRMRLMGSQAPVEVQRLSEDKAVQMGSELLGELMLFAVGAGLISYEYIRSAQKAKEKEVAQDDHIVALSRRVYTLENELKSIKVGLENNKMSETSKSEMSEVKPK